jgi:hypothetical protein
MGNNPERFAPSGKVFGTSEVEYSEQHPCPDTYDPITLRVSKQFSFAPGLKTRDSFKTLRFLLSKFAVEQVPRFTCEETALLYYCYDRCRLESDPSFRRIWLSLAGEALQNLFLWFSGKLKVEPNQSIREVALVYQRLGYLVTAHAYYGWLNTVGALSGALRSINRALRKKAPPKKWMGVGYRDTGTARDPATDASPTWQEVAANRSRSYDRLRPEERDYLDCCNKHLMDLTLLNHVI